MHLLTLNVVLAVTVVCVTGVMRSADRSPKPEPSAVDRKEKPAANELALRQTIDAAKLNRLIGSTSAGDGQPALPTQGAVGGT